MEQETVRGYKAFDPDWTCRGFQYEVGKKYIRYDKIILCENGFHFCRRLIDCFEFYPFLPETKIAVVEASGTIVESGNKCCTDRITIIREVEWEEVLRLVNVGTGNTGRGNSGFVNSGKWNSGDRNSGSYNSGSYNTGSCNSGSSNTGSCNSGSRNSGEYNSGWHNSGSYNSGWYNSGSRNSGSHNSGSHNTGDWNKAIRSSGCFNTKASKIEMFDKPSDWTFTKWLVSRAHDIMAIVAADSTEFIPFEKMTEEEQQKHPELKACGGYYRRRTTEEIFKIQQDNWNRLSEEDKAAVTSLPNFDAEIFEEITGIKI